MLQEKSRMSRGAESNSRVGVESEAGSIVESEGIWVLVLPSMPKCEITLANIEQVVNAC